MKQLTFTAKQEADGRITSQMGETEFNIMEIIGILHNQATMLSEKGRGVGHSSVPVIPRGSSQGSTH